MHCSEPAPLRSTVNKMVGTVPSSSPAQLLCPPMAPLLVELPSEGPLAGSGPYQRPPTICTRAHLICNLHPADQETLGAHPL